MFREEATSALTLLLELEFENVGFSGGRKTGVSGEKPSEQGENQQKKNEPSSVGDENPEKYSWSRARTNNKLNPVR